MTVPTDALCRGELPAAVLVTAAHALTGHSLGLLNSFLGHALRNAIPVSSAEFTTICSPKVEPHVSHDIVLKNAVGVFVASRS